MRSSKINGSGGVETGPCKAGFELERHTASSGVEGGSSESHGDVCRRASAGNDFLCPLGCLSSANAPWCVFKEHGSQALPCRVPEGGVRGGPPPKPQSPTDASLALRSHLAQWGGGSAGGGGAEAGGRGSVLPVGVGGGGAQTLTTPLESPGASSSSSLATSTSPTHHSALRDMIPRATRIGPSEEIQAMLFCDQSTDPERRPQASVERHHLEPNHGDVCRPYHGERKVSNDDVGSGGGGGGGSDDDGTVSGGTDFFCPVGCVHVKSAPYCAAAAASSFSASSDRSSSSSSRSSFSSSGGRTPSARSNSNGSSIWSMFGSTRNLGSTSTSRSDLAAVLTLPLIPPSSPQDADAAAAALEGGVLMPCRTPPPQQKSKLARLEERLVELDRQLKRYQSAGNSQGESKTYSQIKLVKADRRAAAAAAATAAGV